jgi:hypothetical protein
MNLKLVGRTERNLFFWNSKEAFLLKDRIRTRTRNQCCGSVFIFSGSGSGFGSRVWRWRPIRIQSFNDQKLKKNYSWKKKKFFWSKTAIYLSLGLHKVCPGYRRSLQLTKEAIQHFKTLIFSTFVGHFCLPGSGSVFKLRIRIQWSDWIRIQYGSGSGSTTLRETSRIASTFKIFSLQMDVWKIYANICKTPEIVVTFKILKLKNDVW